MKRGNDRDLEIKPAEGAHFLATKASFGNFMPENPGDPGISGAKGCCIENEKETQKKVDRVKIIKPSGGEGIEVVSVEISDSDRKSGEAQREKNQAVPVMELAPKVIEKWRHMWFQSYKLGFKLVEQSYKQKREDSSAGECCQDGQFVTPENHVGEAEKPPQKNAYEP